MTRAVDYRGPWIPVGLPTDRGPAVDGLGVFAGAGNRRRAPAVNLASTGSSRCTPHWLAAED